MPSVRIDNKPCYKLCPVNDLYQITLQVENDGPPSPQYQRTNQSMDIVGEACEQLRQSHAEKMNDNKNRPLKSSLAKMRPQHGLVDMSTIVALEVTGSRESSS